MNEPNTIQNIDNIVIADEVLEKIAGIAIDEVDGAILVSGGIGINNFLGKKNFTKGIKVETKGKEILAKVTIMVEFGSNIQKTAFEIQKNIRQRLEDMTGMTVHTVNVSVIDVQLKKNNKKILLDETLAIYNEENKKNSK